MDDITSDILKITFSVAAGAIIGSEREYKTKSAGFRTIILITLGSTIFTILSIALGGESEKARIASNIITGVGFIGAGVIFKEGAFVKGLTTAAVIWISAAIGMVIGFGNFELASFTLIIAMVVLMGFTWVQNYIDTSNTNRVYKITLTGNNERKIQELYEIFNSCNLKAKCTNRGKRSNEMILTFSIKGSEKNHEELVKQFYSNSLIESFES